MSEILVSEKRENGYSNSKGQPGVRHGSPKLSLLPPLLEEGSHFGGLMILEKDPRRKETSLD